MTKQKQYYAFIERYLADATPEEKDEAQLTLHNFLVSLLKLHAAATRDKKGKDGSVNGV